MYIHIYIHIYVDHLHILIHVYTNTHRCSLLLLSLAQLCVVADDSSVTSYAKEVYIQAYIYREREREREREKERERERGER